MVVVFTKTLSGSGGVSCRRTPAEASTATVMVKVRPASTMAKCGMGVLPENSWILVGGSTGSGSERERTRRRPTERTKEPLTAPWYSTRVGGSETEVSTDSRQREKETPSRRRSRRQWSLSSIGTVQGASRVQWTTGRRVKSAGGGPQEAVRQHGREQLEVGVGPAGRDGAAQEEGEEAGCG